MSDWIPVTERLPEVEDLFYVALVAIQVYDRQYIHTADFINGEWFAHGCRDGTYHVTHWMPLPELPPIKESEAIMPDISNLFANVGSVSDLETLRDNLYAATQSVNHVLSWLNAHQPQQIKLRTTKQLREEWHAETNGVVPCPDERTAILQCRVDALIHDFDAICAKLEETSKELSDAVADRNYLAKELGEQHEAPSWDDLHQPLPHS